jgi:hypothetical protein
MDSAHLLIDAFERVRTEVHETIDDLLPDQLAFRPDPEANSIAWLVWHLARIQDLQVAAVADHPQVWGREGWVDRFALPFDSSDSGYGMEPEEVGLVEVESADLLSGYLDAVTVQTVAYIGGLAADDLDRVVDPAWDPPVTLGVRLVSIVADDLQHVGQAAYVRGLIERRP